MLINSFIIYISILMSIITKSNKTTIILIGSGISNHMNPRVRATAFTFLHKKDKISIMEIKKLKEEIKNISEPRRTAYGNIRHKLKEIIIIGLCTVICGGEDFAYMKEFGKSRKEYLAKILGLSNGIPDSDTFRRVFEKLNPSELSSCMINWISEEREERSVIVVDGKTIRGSGNVQHKTYHVVSAFVVGN